MMDKNELDITICFKVGYIYILTVYKLIFILSKFILDLKFYRLAWDFIADNLLDLAKNFFKTGRLSKGVNHAYVRLILMTASPVGFKEFRHISLIYDI